MCLVKRILRYDTFPAQFRFASSKCSGSGSATSKSKKWKQLSLFVALPAVGLAMINAFLPAVTESEDQKPRPKFIPYEHMRIRTKRFPWGDGQRSLFHNPHVNPLPDGYED